LVGINASAFYETADEPLKRESIFLAPEPVYRQAPSIHARFWPQNGVEAAGNFLNI